MIKTTSRQTGLYLFDIKQVRLNVYGPQFHNRNVETLDNTKYILCENDGLRRGGVVGVARKDCGSWYIDIDYNLKDAITETTMHELKNKVLFDVSNPRVSYRESYFFKKYENLLDKRINKCDIIALGGAVQTISKDDPLFVLLRECDL